MIPTKIISGGQTGADRGGLDAAILLGIEHGGFVPKYRLAEDGRVPDCYRMTETHTDQYPYRTRRNIEVSCATAIVTWDSIERTTIHDRGTILTAQIVGELKKPVIDLIVGGDLLLNVNEAAKFQRWLKEVSPSVLNVAGPRESRAPGIQQRTRDLIVYTLWNTRQGIVLA